MEGSQNNKMHICFRINLHIHLILVFVDVPEISKYHCKARLSNISTVFDLLICYKTGMITNAVRIKSLMTKFTSTKFQKKKKKKKKKSTKKQNTKNFHPSYIILSSSTGGQTV